MSRKWVFAYFMVACLTLIAGCWSRAELTDLAIVSAFAFDKDEEGQYVGTFQIINPGNVPGALQGGASGQNPTVTTYSTTGTNPDELSSQASAKISRRLYYAHTNLLVISEELARDEGLSVILDSLERGLEFRTTARVVIARNTHAGDLVKVLTSIDQVPAEKVIKTLESTEKHYGSSITTNLQELVKSLVSTGKEPLVGGFTIVGNAKKGSSIDSLKSTGHSAVPEANGIALFKEGKLVNWLDGTKARGAMWILDRIKQTTVSIDWGNRKDAIAFQVIRQKADVSAHMKDGQPMISVGIRTEGDLRSVNVPVDLKNPHVLLEIEKSLEQGIKKEIEEAISEAKVNKTDVFGFGEKLYQSKPHVWKALEQNWHDVSFPKLDIEVNVEAFIRRTGVRNNPYLFETEKSKEYRREGSE